MFSLRIIILALAVYLLPLGVEADELQFPTSENAIIQALTLKEGKTQIGGFEYEVKDGEVYQFSGGKRFRARGLQDIVDSELAPRARAFIQFDFNSARIKPESYRLLDEFGKALNNPRLASATVEVQGHTDDIGDIQFNFDLAEKRALAVVNYLVQKQHIAMERLAIRAFGENRPIASNSTEKGRITNRRVEFVRK